MQVPDLDKMFIGDEVSEKFGTFDMLRSLRDTLSKASKLYLLIAIPFILGSLPLVTARQSFSFIGQLPWFSSLQMGYAIAAVLSAFIFHRIRDTSRPYKIANLTLFTAMVVSVVGTYFIAGFLFIRGYEAGSPFLYLNIYLILALYVPILSLVMLAISVEEDIWPDRDGTKPGLRFAQVAAFLFGIIISSGSWVSYPGVDSITLGMSLLLLVAVPTLLRGRGYIHLLSCCVLAYFSFTANIILSTSIRIPLPSHDIKLSKDQFDVKINGHLVSGESFNVATDQLVAKARGLIAVAGKNQNALYIGVPIDGLSIAPSDTDVITSLGPAAFETITKSVDAGYRSVDYATNFRNKSHSNSQEWDVVVLNETGPNGMEQPSNISIEAFSELKSMVADDGFFVFPVLSDLMSGDRYSINLDKTIRSVFDACVLEISSDIVSKSALYICKKNGASDSSIYTDRSPSHHTQALRAAAKWSSSHD